jgi:hypothetical protein
MKELKFQLQTDMYRNFAAESGIENVGVVTSRFQQAPFRGDLWTEQLYKGVSGTVGALWRDRNSLLFKYPVLDFEHEVYKNMRAKLDKVLKFYEHDHQVGQAEGRAFTMELDGDVIHDIFNPAQAAEKVDPRHRSAYLRAMATIANDAVQQGVTFDIVLNQYAGFNADSADSEISDRLNGTPAQPGTKIQLADYLDHELAIQGVDLYNRSKVLIGEIPTDNEAFWDKYIDFAEMSGSKHIRLSAEFTRLFEHATPGAVVFNEAEFEKFSGLINKIKSRGLEFNLCFMHYTLPNFIKDGWENPDAAKILTNMSMSTLRRLQAMDKDAGGKGNFMPDRVYSINEPIAALATGYVDESWPPYKGTPNIMLGIDRYLRKIHVKGKELSIPMASVQRFEQVLDRTVDFHEMLFDQMKADTNLQKIPMGFTYNLPSYSPYYPLATDQLVSTMIEYVNEQWLYKLFDRSRVKGRVLFDSFGLQYYNKYYVGMFKRTMAANAGVIDVPERFKPFINGWTRFHEGMPEKVFRVNAMILKLCNDLLIDKKHLDKLPDIFISEAGFPSLVDPEPEMMNVAEAIKVAQANSILNISGVSLWTAQDNFEWAFAYSGGHFGYLDRHGKQKPKSHIKLAGLDVLEVSMHREMDKMLKQAVAFRQNLQTNGMGEEMRESLTHKIDEVLHFHTTNGGSYFRNQTLIGLLGRVLNPRGK